MVIIFEGIDRVGKTTLANKISKELGIKVYKKERECGNSGLINNYNYAINYGNALGHVQLWNSNVFEGNNIIVDRFHWTEYVYSYFDRNYTNNYMISIENEMLKHRENYIMVLVQPTDLKKSEEEHGSSLELHNDMFNNLYEYTSLQKIKCKYNDYGYLVGAIKGYMLKNEFSKKDYIV